MSTIFWLTSYAPLLAKDGHHNWDPDMIYFSNTEVRPTPAYETQRLFSVYGGDRYVKTTLKSDAKVAHRLGASLVKDSKTGRRYLKLVNALPVALRLTLEGITIPEGTTAEGFEGEPEQQAVKVTTGPLTIEGGTVVLPPYAIRVVSL